MKTLFDLQRTSLEGGQQAIERGIDAQRRLVEATMRNGVTAHRSAQRHGLELTRQWMVASAGSGWAGTDEQREEIDEQFGAMADAQDEAWGTIEGSVEEGLAGYEGLAERQKEFVERSVGSLVDANERAKRTTIDISGGTQAVTEQGSEAIEESVEELTESFEQISGLGRTYVERLGEAGIDSMEALAEAQADAVAQATEVSKEQAEEWIDTAEQ